MKYELKDDDYLDLWKYFRSEAAAIKGAMFRTITWIIGFAAALLAFISAIITDFDASKSAVSLATFVIALSLAGIFICLYAWFTLGESAKHVKSNWKYADRCLNNIESLGSIIALKEKKKKSRSMNVWDRLRIVVFLFLTGFFGALILTGFLWYSYGKNLGVAFNLQ